MAVGVVAVAGVLAACGKGPARTALETADAAIEAVRPEAEAFVPVEWGMLQEAAKAAHDKFSKGDYSSALSAAQELPAKAKDVAATAARKKEEALKSWEELQGSLPQLMQALAAKLGTLSAAKKLPKDVDRAAVEAAQEALPGITQLWHDAGQSASRGDLMGAVIRAGEARDRAQELMRSVEPAGPAAEAASAK